MYLMRRIFFLCQPASLVRVGHEEGKGDVGGKGNTEYKSLSFRETTSSQAPSYASPKLRLTESLTGVKCRATSVAKKTKSSFFISKICSIYCQKDLRATNVGLHNCEGSEGPLKHGVVESPNTSLQVKPLVCFAWILCQVSLQAL